jgi:hypothetical protein
MPVPADDIVLDAVLVENGQQDVARALTTVRLLVDERHVLETGGGDPLAVLAGNQRLVGRDAKHLGIALGRDLQRPDVHGDDRDARVVRDFHFCEEHRAVELAGDRDDVLLGDEPFGRRRALLGLAAGVLKDDLDRPSEHAPLGVDLLGGEFGRLLHECAFGVAARRRQRPDPANLDRVRRVDWRCHELCRDKAKRSDQHGQPACDMPTSLDHHCLPPCLERGPPD